MKDSWYCIKSPVKKALTNHRAPILRIICVALLVTGCSIASDPDKMTIGYVSPTNYEDLDCNQLAMRIVELGYRIDDLHDRLAERRKRDQWQAAFGWFYGFSALYIDGDGPEAEEFKRLKGDFEAARIQAFRKDCNLDAPTPKDIVEKAKQQLNNQPMQN